MLLAALLAAGLDALAPAATPPPAGGAGGTVAVVALDAPAGLAGTGRALADALAREGAARPGLSVRGPADVERALGRDEAKALSDCADDGHCLAERGSRLGADRIVCGWLTLEAGRYRVALVAVDGRTGARLHGVVRDVPVSAQRLKAEVAAEASRLLGGAPAAPPDEAAPAGR